MRLSLLPLLCLLSCYQTVLGALRSPVRFRAKRPTTTTEPPIYTETETPAPPPGLSQSSTALSNIHKHKATVEWTYWGPNGERNWERMFKTCRGKSQSPVNIESERVVYLQDMQLTLINYDHALKNIEMSNNGHTVKLRPVGEGRRAFVTGSAINDRLYRFVEGHFHWRNAHKSGSEHAIDGEKYSMELHLVHQNVRYEYEQNSEKVISAPDAFLVMAIFYNETTHEESGPNSNEYLDRFLKYFENIVTSQTSTMLNETIRLEKFIPDSTKFYRYEGSYTTPACNEIVTWIVFPTVLDISPSQMQKFHELIRRRFGRNDDEKIGFYRHIQELGTRRIYAPEEMRSSGTSGKFPGHISTLTTTILSSLMFLHLFSRSIV